MTRMAKLGRHLHIWYRRGGNQPNPARNQRANRLLETHLAEPARIRVPTFPRSLGMLLTQSGKTTNKKSDVGANNGPGTVKVKLNGADGG